MALAMTRPTKDSRGVYEYKTRYPKDLAHLFKPHARWKRSLGTSIKPVPGLIPRRS